MWNLKQLIQINLFTKQKQTHRQKANYGYQRGKRKGKRILEFEINRYTLLYIKEQQGSTI